MSGGDAGAYDKIWYGCWVCDAELPHRPHSFFRVAHMAAGLLNMHKDGLGAALGIVGVAVWLYFIQNDKKVRNYVFSLVCETAP